MSIALRYNELIKLNKNTNTDKNTDKNIIRESIKILSKINKNITTNCIFYKNFSFSTVIKKNNFNSSSSSIIKHPFLKDKFILNTRLVNYYLKSDGSSVNNYKKTIIRDKKTELLSPFNKLKSSLDTDYLTNYNKIKAEEKEATNDLDNTIAGLLKEKEESFKDFNLKTQDKKNYESQIRESTRHKDFIEYMTNKIKKLTLELSQIKNP